MPENKEIINDLIFIGYSRQNAVDIFQKYEKLNNVECLVLRIKACKEEILNGLSDV